MLLSPTRKALSIYSICVDSEKPTQKEMTTAIEKFCWDNASQSFLNLDAEHKGILNYSCQVKKITHLVNALFKYQLEEFVEATKKLLESNQYFWYTENTALESNLNRLWNIYFSTKILERFLFIIE